MLKRIPLVEVEPNPAQPRKIFDVKPLRELAASIRENGLMQPITVRPAKRDDGSKTYVIVAGERRWRAHCLLAEEGKLDPPEILVHVKRMDDDEMAISAIIENLARVDITPLDEARAFQAMLDRGYTPEQLAKKLGLGQTWRVTYRVRLLSLDEDLQKLVASGALSLNQGQAIAKLPHGQQLRIAQAIARGALRGDAAVMAAVEAVIDGLNQRDIFGAETKPSDKDVATLSRMETKIAQVQGLVAMGWKDGECVAATKVDPNRAALMADRIGEIRKALYVMERDLRNVQAQAELAVA